MLRVFYINLSTEKDRNLVFIKVIENFGAARNRATVTTIVNAVKQLCCAKNLY